MLLIPLFLFFGLLPKIQSKCSRESIKGGMVTVLGFTKYSASPPLHSHCLIPKVLVYSCSGSGGSWLFDCVWRWTRQALTQEIKDTHSMSQVRYPRSWALGGGAGAHILLRQWRRAGREWGKQNETEEGAKEGCHPRWSQALVWSQRRMGYITELQTGVQPSAQGGGHSHQSYIVRLPWMRVVVQPPGWRAFMQWRPVFQRRDQLCVLRSHPGGALTESTDYRGMNEWWLTFGRAEAIEMPVVFWLPGSRLSSYY